MTVTGDWLEPGFAKAWAEDDRWSDLLQLPRALACAVVRESTTEVRSVVDVGSGPGSLLGIFLDAFPQARGVWIDVAPEMEPLARERLGRFGDRVSYHLHDMTQLASLSEARDADVLMTARAAHHLDEAGARAFYATAERLLRPKGWFINLDHVGTSDAWGECLKAVRPRFTRPDAGQTSHPHEYPFASPAAHLQALREAGFEDPEMPWRTLSLCLFMARRPAEG